MRIPSRMRRDRGRQGLPGVAVAVSCLVAALLLQGCAVRGLSFVRDERIEILSPPTNETVTLPLEVTWRLKEPFDGVIALFFGRSTPMRPGGDLRSLVPDDDPCKTDPGCPTTQWLRDRSIYLVPATETRLAVESLPDLRVGERSSKDRHELIIVLLDGAGTRTNESVFTREFIIDRGD